MALIDFKCKECGNEFFEIINGENIDVACSKCGSTKVERIYKGKYYGKGSSCSGSCSGCSGCH